MVDISPELALRGDEGVRHSGDAARVDGVDDDLRSGEETVCLGEIDGVVGQAFGVVVGVGEPGNADGEPEEVLLALDFGGIGCDLIHRLQGDADALVGLGAELIVRGNVTVGVVLEGIE